MTLSDLLPPLNDSATPNKELIVSKNQNKTFSKAQTLFNRYSEKIQRLRKHIEKNQLKFENLSAYYKINVTPKEEDTAHKTVEFTKALYRHYTYERLTNDSKEKLGLLILRNLNRAFQHIVPTDDVKEIYDAVNDISYDNEEKDYMDELKNEMEEVLRKKFGVDMDFSAINNTDSENMNRRIAEIENQFQKNEGNSTTEKKTKKQLEAEAKFKEVEELKNKSLRTIYTSLAKLLHPDKELDEQIKIEKGDLMKKVTTAYKEKDLHTLLKIEIEIIDKENKNLHHLTDQKLSIFNTVLKEQVDELEREKYALIYHPKYHQISFLANFSEQRAKHEMNDRVKNLEREMLEINSDIERLNDKRGKVFLNKMLNTIKTTTDSFELVNPIEKDFADFFKNEKFT